MLDTANIVRRPSSAPQPAARVLFGIVLSLLFIAGGTLAGPLPTARAAEPLKAVVIVGPTGSLTSQNLTNGERMADAAESRGMAVTRVYHPRATWSRVLSAIQGANLVIYMGHGNGWPSPYGPFQERTKNGFGLNPFEGSKASEHKYYGGDPIRANVRLADNAVVIFVHLCYASGNGEPGMPIPREDVARQRVDNYAAAFLNVGARAVFTSSYFPKLDIVGALNTTNKTMDELFMTPAWGGPGGFVGWRNTRFASDRTAGAANHLDPHPSYGYVRALSGDLSMTSAEWRGTVVLETSADITPPTAPQGLATRSLGYRRVELIWQPSTDDSGGTIRYRIFRDGLRIATVTTTSHVDRPAAAGTYSYKVRALDPSGNRSAFSESVAGQAISGEP